MGLFSLIQSALALIGALGITLAAFLAVERLSPYVVFEHPEQENAPAIIAKESPAESIAKKENEGAPSDSPGTPDTPAAPSRDIVSSVSETVSSPAVSKAPDTWEIARVKNPYGIPPRPFDEVNAEARAALVNIFCNARGGLSPITASGVFISGSGVILTNAHVAQYVLLEHTGKVNLRCVARTGSPAHDRFLVRVLYIPPEWVREHAHEITQSQSVGTGEHDWALLYVTGSVDGSALPAPFPHLPPDVRSAIGFTGDPVLAASYPAGFLGGLVATQNLYPASAPTTIEELMTFSSGSADIFSVGGTVTAQSGSSGGAVVNLWGYVIGLVTTMREGNTTAERDLRALTLNYIHGDLKVHTGSDLTAFIADSLPQKAASFWTSDGLILAELLIEKIKR